MTLNDPLAKVLSHLVNSEQIAKNEATIGPVSNVLRKILNIMKDLGYIGEFTEIDDGKGKIVKINLLGKINNCGVIKPRFAVKKDEFTKYEKRYLPARGFGLLMVSTNQGILTHIDAKKQGLGGKLIAYCY